MKKPRANSCGEIRPARPGDLSEWVRMRTALWPSDSAGHRRDIRNFFERDGGGICQAWVLARAEGGLGGFLELNLRTYAEGSELSPVPYLEGWYVDEDLRGGGHGAALLGVAENWCREHGFEQLASDAEIDNDASIAAHRQLGFTEIGRIVCMLKKL